MGRIYSIVFLCGCLMALTAGFIIENGCPVLACETIHMDSCRKTNVFIAVTGDLCTGCDLCIEPDGPVDQQTGCPLLTCSYIGTTICFRPGYFAFNGTICPSCHVPICPM